MAGGDRLMEWEAVQNELNTTRDKKLVWDKISQGIADRGYLRNLQQCRRLKLTT